MYTAYPYYLLTLRFFNIAKNKKLCPPAAIHGRNTEKTRNTKPYFAPGILKWRSEKEPISHDFQFIF